MRDPEDEDNEDKSIDEDERRAEVEDREERIRNIKERHPGYSQESYRAGDFLGVNFPYVPGDPFW